MKKVPPLYAVFCVVVLALFVYAKVEGLGLFNSGVSTPGTGGSGGHGGGVFLGSHK